MARISVANINDNEKRILSVLMHYDSLLVRHLIWLMNNLLPSGSNLYSPDAKKLIEKYPKLNPMAGFDPSIVESIHTMYGNGLLNLGLNKQQFLAQFTHDAIMKLNIRLTDTGKKYAESIAKGRDALLYKPKQTIFIANSFHNHDVKDLIETELKPACEKLGYEPVVGNELIGSGMIQHQLEENISEAQAIIGDLTDARPSVYFEIGLAHALGMPLILYCRDGDGDDVHFDVKHYPVERWHKTDDNFAFVSGRTPLEYIAAKLNITVE